MRLHAWLFCFALSACADASGFVIRLRASDGGLDAMGARDAGVDARAPDPDAQIDPQDGGSTVTVRGTCRILIDSGFNELFEGPGLDPARFLVAQGNLAVASDRFAAGFAAGNVRQSNGKLVLSVRGDDYMGSVRGTNLDGSARSDGKRSGAALATRDLFHSATYQWTLSLANVPEGVELTLFTARDQVEDGYVVLRVPGFDGTSPSFSWVTGLLAGPSTSAVERQLPLTAALDDGASHTLRFDWRAGTQPADLPTVALRVDDNELETVAGSAPLRASRAFMALTVRDGVPAPFDTFEVAIEELFITTFEEAKDLCEDGELSLEGLKAPQ